jgi:hypothetical protein
LSRTTQFFFPEFNIRLYDKNSESHYFFFLHQNQNIFFSNIWLFFQKWYDGLTSKIRWNGSISEPIQKLQGVRQGGIWSPTAYKIGGTETLSKL